MGEGSVVVGEASLVARLGGKNHLIIRQALWLDAHELATQSFSRFFFSGLQKCSHRKGYVCSMMCNKNQNNQIVDVSSGFKLLIKVQLESDLFDAMCGSQHELI